MKTTDFGVPIVVQLFRKGFQFQVADERKHVNLNVNPPIATKVQVFVLEEAVAVRVLAPCCRNSGLYAKPVTPVLVFGF